MRCFCSVRALIVRCLSELAAYFSAFGGSTF